MPGVKTTGASPAARKACSAAGSGASACGSYSWKPAWAKGCGQSGWVGPYQAGNRATEASAVSIMWSQKRVSGARPSAPRARFSVGITTGSTVVASARRHSAARSHIGIQRGTGV